VATTSPRQETRVVMQHASSGRTRAPETPRGKVCTQRNVPDGAALMASLSIYPVAEATTAPISKPTATEPLRTSGEPQISTRRMVM